MSLSIIVITNKAKLSDIFLQHLKFGDELIIDNSKTLNGFADKRNKAQSNAKGDWVLFVDDDEIVSRGLAKEIIESIKTNIYSGYFIKRIDTVFNKELKYGETGKVKIVRLAEKKSGKFVRSVHETWNINGQLGILKNHLYHIKDSFVSEFIGRVCFYGPLDANSLNKEGKKFSYFKLFVYPLAKFLNNYFVKLGFLDGLSGLFLAYFMSVQSLSVRVFQWENQN